MPVLEPPFTDPNTATSLSGGTIALRPGGLPRIVGGGIKFKKRDFLPGPKGATVIHPEWRVSIYWDGDDQTPTDYLDRPNTGLPSAVPIVTDWGQLVQQGKGVRSFDTYSFRVANVPLSGARFSDNWSASDPPEGKRVEVYILQDTTWQILFTGEIVEVPRVDELEVDIICGSIAEALDRPLLQAITLDDWPQAPSASLARFQPVVFGAVERVEGVLVQENKSVALASSLTSTATTVELAEDPGFTTPGSVRVDLEQMSFTGVDLGPPIRLTGVVRGTNGTTPADHPVGSQVVEVGPVTWLFSVHSSTLTNPKLVDSAGNLRDIPADLTPTISSGPPATIQLPSQPVLSSLGVDASRVFKFVDTESTDTQNTDTGFTASEVNVIAGRSDEYTETNSVLLSATDPSRQFVGVSRDTAVALPEGSTFKRAWVVVEHYLPTAAQDRTAALTTAAGAADTELLVDSVTGFPTSGTLYMGEERVTYAGTTTLPSPRFTGVVRGANQFGATTHPIGTKCVQSALEVRMRPTPGFVGLIDGEGFCRVAPTAPEEIVQDAGLQVISKGFEDAHTHVVPGTHDHDTDTSHTHTTPVIIDWQPSLMQARSAMPIGSPCTGGPPGWDAMDQLIGVYAGGVDGNIATSAPWVWDVPAQLEVFGFYFMRGTSTDLSPNDTRLVKGVECTVVTSASSGITPGTSTASWAFNSTLGICQIQESRSSSDVGGPILNVSTGVLSESTINFGDSNPGANGNVLSEFFDIPRSVATYQANPNIQYVDTFSRDISSAGLRVQDFVSSQYGGSTGFDNWIQWKTPNLDVHVLQFRLLLEEETDTQALDPLEDVAWPDTDSADALKYSSLSWFEITDRITTPADLVGSTIQVNHAQASPYLSDASVLRAMYVLELENVTVSGNSEVPTRMVADVDGLSGTKATTHMNQVVTNAQLLGQLTADYVDTAALNAIFPLITTQSAGVVYDQAFALDVIHDLAEQHRVLAFWSPEGKLTGAYLGDTGNQGQAVYTFRSPDLLPTAGGPVISRAPLRDLINDVVVRGGPDALADGGWKVTSAQESASSKTAYGLTKSLAIDARFIQDQASADVLAAHVLDYNAELPQRYTFRAHIENTDSFAPGIGDVVALDTFEVVKSNLIVERRVIAPGSGRDRRHAFVEYTCVDRG